jgi:tetratricopeptide (TPR) repeat protein
VSDDPQRHKGFAVTAEAVRRARRLLGEGRPADALAITAPLAAQPAPDAAVLAAHAAALQASGDQEAALHAYEAAASAAPASGVAQHNIAAVLGDLRRFAEAKAATERAFARGTDAPETWLVHARALVGLGELDAAEAAFEEALARRGDYADAHRDLAQLVWMRTGDAGAALRRLDGAIARAPGALALRLVRAKGLEFVGDLAGAAAAVEAGLRVNPGDVALRLAAAHVAGLRGQVEEAAEHAAVAAAVAPSDPAVAAALCAAWLGLGAAAEAAQLAEAMRARAPHNQMAWALQATAWRLVGDPRWRALWDFDRTVRSFVIPTPAGWTDLPAYLADLRGALLELHGELRTHPLEQSLRGGSQTTQNLQMSEHPALRAFFEVIDTPLRQYITSLEREGGPLQARNTGGWRVKGAWSVRLRPGGSHVDHVHTEGWISSAFYVEVPTAVDGPDRQGWLRFGQPPFPTRPALEAGLFVKPAPGSLVLFPSYLWHGTVPFVTDETRLTIAMDFLPG